MPNKPFIVANVRDILDLYNKEVQEVAEKIQQECHETVQMIMKEVKDCNVQDATNVFIFRKLAEIVVELSNRTGEQYKL